MVDSVAALVIRRLDGDGKLPLIVALATLAVIALFPLAGPELKADFHLLGQALPVLNAVSF